MRSMVFYHQRTASIRLLVVTNTTRGTQTWSSIAGFQVLGRMDNIAMWEKCADIPGAGGTRTKREDQQLAVDAKSNQTRTHPRDLTGRQGPSGGFLDPNIYIWFGCSNADPGGDDAGDDACDAADDEDPCNNYETDLPTTNGAKPTDYPPPPASEGGFSTGPITSVPPGQTIVPLSYVSCSTQEPDPDHGIAQGYCVCSSSTFPLSTDASVTPPNYCAYTSPLPASTTSISTITTTTPTTTPTPTPTPTPQNQISIIFDSGCDDTTCYAVWYIFSTAVGSTVDTCALFPNSGPDPIFIQDAPENETNGELYYASSLGPFHGR